MNKYKIIYQYSDGRKGKKIVYAANRIMAFEIFMDLGYKDVVNADCFRVLEDEDEDEDEI